MSFRVIPMVIGHYAAVRALWEATPGVGLNQSDTEIATRAFLERNHDLSAVAVDGSRIIGAVLCGHDGRRGYLHHLAVALPFRRQGVASALVAHCLERLSETGIDKCNIFLYADNEDGAAFWLHGGWQARDDLRMLQKRTRSAAQRGSHEFPVRRPIVPLP